MTTHRFTHLFATALALFLSITITAQTKLLRFPDIHDGTVVFCYAGDLWKASADGGDAVRLTAHEGQEIFPKFSPDGKWIAFTGQYDGDEQVYVIPVDGWYSKTTDLLPCPRTSCTALGVRQPGIWLVPGWRESVVPVRFAMQMEEALKQLCIQLV